MASLKKIFQNIHSAFSTYSRQGNKEGFQEYIAKDRVFDDYVFDFIIYDEIGASWYDGSPQQIMPERVWCKNKINLGNTVVDCGAHHGMMSVLFSHWVGPKGKVIAFEPLEDSANVVKRNAKLNGLKNIEVHAQAVGAENGTFPINKSNSNAIMRLENGASVSGKSGGVVETVRLDDALGKLNVDLLKIDVEGFELEALQGAGKIISEQKPILDIELHCFAFSNRNEFINKFMDLIPIEDYDFEVLEEIFSPMKKIKDIKELVNLSKFDNPHLLCSPKKPF